jgi:N-acyl-D-amino-acid deacylase
MKQGKGVGGRAMTVGYGLWAFGLADTKADKMTEAMVSYLLKTQRSQGHWTGQMCRPPLEESYLTCTVLAIQGMQRYAIPSQRAAVDGAVAKAKAWLATAAVKGQEDKAARLWGLHLLGAKPAKLREARAAVLKAQRDDGGWAQLDEMDSDAYATGQTLYLLQATGLDAADPAYQRGVRFLLQTQRPDGSWLVVSRSKPIQPYYAVDDEDPLGKNQFISVAATSWAVAALAVAVEPSRAQTP